MLFMNHAENNSKPLYFSSNKKKKKVVLQKAILGSDIYAKPLNAQTGCDTTSSISRIRKAILFRKPLTNNYLIEVALVFITLHKGIESAGNKSNVYYFQERHRPFLQYPTPQKSSLQHIINVAKLENCTAFACKMFEGEIFQ